MRRLIFKILLSLFIALPAYAQRAVPLEALISGLTDSTGAPLASGKVYSYAAGTSTPKSLWQDNAQSSAHTNPATLDSQGKLLAFAEGNYKLVIKNSSDVTQYTLDNLWFSSNDVALLNVGTTGGSANAQTGSTSVDISSTIPTGTIVRGIAGYTNTGAATFNLNGDGAVTIKTKRSASVDLGAGAILAGEVFAVYYDGTYWRLLSDREGWKSYTPTYTASSGTLTSVTTVRARYERVGNTVTVNVKAYGTTSTTPTGLRASLPVTAANVDDIGGGGWASDGGTAFAGYVAGIDTSTVEVRHYSASAFSAGATRYLSFSVTYEAA